MECHRLCVCKMAHSGLMSGLCHHGYNMDAWYESSTWNHTKRWPRRRRFATLSTPHSRSLKHLKYKFANGCITPYITPWVVPWPKKSPPVHLSSGFIMAFWTRFGSIGRREARPSSSTTSEVSAHRCLEQITISDASTWILRTSLCVLEPCTMIPSNAYVC